MEGECLSYINELYIFQCMGKIVCVEFFHTKFLTHTLKGMTFIQYWKFKSSQIDELISIFEMPPRSRYKEVPLYDHFLNVLKCPASLFSSLFITVYVYQPPLATVILCQSQISRKPCMEYCSLAIHDEYRRHELWWPLAAYGDICGIWLMTIYGK